MGQAKRGHVPLNATVGPAGALGQPGEPQSQERLFGVNELCVRRRCRPRRKVGFRERTARVTLGQSTLLGATQSRGRTGLTDRSLTHIETDCR